MLKMKKYIKHLAGKRVYPIWNLYENISWHNFFTYPMGLIYGLLTFEWLQKKHRYMIWRLKPWKIWLPPVYADNYYYEEE